MINLKALFVLLKPKDNWYSSIQILDAPSNSMDTPKDSSITLLPSTNGFVTEKCKWK